TTAGALVKAMEAWVPVRWVAGKEGQDRVIGHPRIQKSGLIFAGHRHGLVPTRIQVFGETELSFFESLPKALRSQRAGEYFGLLPSLSVVTRGAEVPQEWIQEAERYLCPLVVAQTRSSQTIAVIHALLDELLAPRILQHGVMVEVHGVGVLLVGKSGIGKSECALFLVERGHRLVADDQVEVILRSDGRLMGRAPPPLRHHLEVRGLGILNIRELFGATAVRDEMPIELVIHLRSFEASDEIDRLGIDEHHTDILGKKVPTVILPVRAGRDMGVLIEVAARNYLLQRSGFRLAQAFVEQIDRLKGLR
ncbi:MAG: HPr(Ser) kinase/phosphatase, partial [Sandaracinaceae bacterium]|nr:HPr(Ser) kinase/phosphatase [Sandaracinaceae bacterium]